MKSARRTRPSSGRCVSHLSKLAEDQSVRCLPDNTRLVGLRCLLARSRVVLYLRSSAVCETERANAKTPHHMESQVRRAGLRDGVSRRRLNEEDKALNLKRFRRCMGDPAPVRYKCYARFDAEQRRERDRRRRLSGKEDGNGSLIRRRALQEGLPPVFG